MNPFKTGYSYQMAARQIYHELRTKYANHHEEAFSSIIEHKSRKITKKKIPTLTISRLFREKNHTKLQVCVFRRKKIQLPKGF